jgi:hypothetical protein
VAVRAVRFTGDLFVRWCVAGAGERQVVLGGSDAGAVRRRCGCCADPAKRM